MPVAVKGQRGDPPGNEMWGLAGISINILVLDSRCRLPDVTTEGN